MVNKSKLSKNLHLLSPKELRRFQDFVHSPFFNKHQPTTLLLDFLLQKLNNPKNIPKQDVFHHIFPNETYEEFKVNNVMSYLMDLLNQFLTQIGFEKRNEKWGYNLEAVLDRNMEQLFKTNTKKAQKELEKQLIQDSLFYHESMKIYRLNDLHIINQEKEKRFPFLEKGIGTLDIYYLIKKLRFSCELLSREKILNQKFEYPYLDFLIEKIDKNQSYFQKIPALFIYFNIFKLLKEEKNEQYYEQVILLLDKEYQHFTIRELREIYSYILNYSINQFNLGKTSFLNELFNIYQQMIKRGVLLRNNKLDEIAFRNIINTACKIKEFDWALDFLEKYNRFIIPEQRKNAYNFNLANLFFNQGKFEETITLLQKIKFTTSIYSLNTKFILIKSYYELNLDKLLFSFLESFRIFILRNKQIPKYQKESCFNFIHLLHKIASLKDTLAMIHKNEFLQKAAALKLQISQNKSPLIGKEWLLEKIDNM